MTESPMHLPSVPKKCVMAVSGGMDSSTLAAVLTTMGVEVHPVIFVYGSKHNPYETQAAARICDYYGLTDRARLVDMTTVFSNMHSNLLVGGGDIPEGHYEADSMSQTVVPGRNTIFISILLGIAQSVGADAIAVGVHAGDHHIYPDCRAEYIVAMAHAVKLASEGAVRLLAPFINLHKQHIIRYGLDAALPPVPYAHTRTCYKDQPIACGRCGSCQERLEAFRAIGLEDPAEYETREILPKEGA